MNDTIAAISSGLTESGIGIIRISGSEAYSIVDSVFRNSRNEHVNFSIPNRVHHGYILENVSRETLDEVLVINMKSPHSYTGEDTIEIDCHGGILMMRRILETVISSGARPAEPGEFTKRAFLNGKLDLAQAEAVIDIINAKNRKAISASVRQLKGCISRKIAEIRSEILNDTAFIEAALDDPEHYNVDGFGNDLKNHAIKWKKEIAQLIKSYDRGRYIREGINTAIIGKPNVGKSSLLNAVCGEERAIVTQIPGTTRDTITETISLGNISINIYDTAGIRKTDDVVESIGVRRAIECASKADLILFLIDLSRPLDDDDRQIIESISGYQSSLITVFNKKDLVPELSPTDVLSMLPEGKRNHIFISAKSNDGIEELFELLSNMYDIGDIDFNDEVVITSVRHLDLLKKAVISIDGLISSIEGKLPEDFYTIDLIDAYRSLGEITGDQTGDDLINEIFSRFCMGK